MVTEKRPITVADLYGIHQVEDPRISPDGEWVAFVHVEVDETENGYKRTIWLARLTDESTPTQITRGGKDSSPRWSPNGKTLAFVSARSDKPQIYLLPVSMPGGEARQLTQQLNGASHPVWSPNGAQIAFLSATNSGERSDEDNPPPPPIDRLDGKHRQERRAEDEKKRFDPRVETQVPYRVGTSYLTDRHTQVYVVPVAEGLAKEEAKPRRLTNDYVSYQNPEWMPDGGSIVASRTDEPDQDEPHRRSRIYRIALSDGAVTKLTADDHTAFAPKPSPDGSKVAFMRYPVEQMSLTIGRLSVLDITSGDVRDLTTEFDQSPVVVQWDGDSLLFSSQGRGTAGIYRVASGGGTVEPVVVSDIKAEAFDHHEGVFAYAASTALQPPELYVRRSDDTTVQYTKFNQSLLDEVIVQPTHHVEVTSEDGQTIDGWYILPVGYKEGERYPLALQIHGGPHVMWGAHEASMWHEFQTLAANGYLVYFSNPRGSGGYGEAFQRAVFANWGPVAQADVLAGVNLLIERGLADPDKLAITGGSYGGYLTTWIIGHTDRFKAAVSQRGVYNLLSFFGTSDIPSFVLNEFGTTPLDDPQMLWENSPLAHAHKITTPTLILHSENDFRVPVSEGEQLFGYLRRVGVPTGLVRYPREGHELSRTGEPEHRADRLRRILDWFDQYCKA